ncbi:MAG TPA: prepilin-type N-terminal cleavage/methylation domain-containing protein [Patescibacteria group bacterium]|jgi:prepilin-type N-terminal cleavage/methylation domain-containing protein|nr:prepilin-type N-terminal cleavage/methylation domain-containing protein [Patescibacteria group bacterium]
MSVLGNTQGHKTGFTLLELMVVVVLLALLVTGVVWVDSALISSTKQSRDAERATDVKSIALLFEQYYRSSPTGAGSTYPTTQQVTGSISSLVPNKELLTPPLMSDPALGVAADTATQSPTTDEYTYQPFNAFGTLCTTTPPCVRFVLYYHTEDDDVIKTVESSHQQ